MNGRIGVLTVVLCLQLAAIAMLLLQRGGAEPVGAALLDFESAEVDRIRITQRGSQEAELVLRRETAGWRADSLPVSEPQVAQLLDKLAALDSPWPVATTAAAAKRFEVTEDGYAKYVELFAGERAIAQLLLGTSPGFKRIHARLPGQDAIYSIALSSLDLPVAKADWLDKNLLGNDLQVQRIARLAHWEAVQSDAGAVTSTAEPSVAWSLRALDSPAAPNAVAADPKALATLIGRFANVQVTGVADESGEPIDRFEVEGAQNRLEYTLYHDAEADTYALSRDDLDGRFAVPGYIAEQLRAALGNLVKAEVEAEPEAATPSPADGDGTDG